jgi:hypothetical protein
MDEGHNQMATEIAFAARHTAKSMSVTGSQGAMTHTHLALPRNGTISN